MRHYRQFGRLALGAIAILVFGLLPAQAYADGTTDPSTTTITASPNPVSVDVGETTITVQAEDQFGTNLTTGGDTVTLSTDNGTLSAVTDNTDGTYTATLSDTVAETDTVSGTINSADITSGDAVVVFNPGAADPTMTTIEASPNPLTVDTNTSTITVQAVDQYGNDLVAGGDAVALHTTGGLLSAVTDNGNGAYTAFLSDNVARTDTVTGTINLADITSQASVEFDPGAADAVDTTIAASLSTVGVGGSSTITVRAKDQYGNNLTAGGDTVLLNANHGTLGAVTDHGNGTYTATLSDTVARTDTVTGTINGDTIPGNAPVAFTPGAANAAHTTITVSPNPVSVDVGSSTVTVQAKDQYGNNLTGGGATVLLNANHGSLGAVTDHSNGTYTATLSDTVAETDTVSGSINAASITSGNPAVVFTPGAADPAMTTITASPNPVSVDAGSSTVTVQAKDQYGNNLTSGGATVLLNTDNGSLGAVTDNTDGTYTATLTDIVAETDTVSGTINGDAITSGNPAVVFTPGAADPAMTTITAAPTTANVGSSSTITVQAEDQYGNDLTTGSDTVLLNTDHGSLGAVTDNGDGTYTATLSDTLAETDTVSGTINGDAITSGDAVVVFSPTAATHFVVSAPAGATAGVAFNVTVTAKDASGNTAPSYAGIVKITSSDSTAVLPANATLTNGVGTFSVTLKKAGSQTVTATDTVTSTITGTSATITVAAAAATHLGVASAASVNSGTALVVTVTALDAYGNTAPTYAGSVKMTTSDAYGSLPASAGTLTSGVGTFSVTLRTVGSQSVTATDTVTSTITGTKSGIVVLALPSTYHALTPARILDTRYTIGLSPWFYPGVPRTFLVAGRGGVPTSVVVTAVTGNLTVTGQTGAGSLYIGPTPIVSPSSSMLSFPVGDNRATGLTVALSGGGTLSITYLSSIASAKTQVVFDVTGYFSPDATGTNGAKYFPLTPARILDSRPTAKSGNPTNTGLAGVFRSHVARTFQVAGRGGVPSSGVIAVTGNLTVTGQTSLGYLYIGPTALNYPTTSTLNFPKGDNRANAVTVTLGSGGKLSVTYAASSLSATSNVIFDVTGYLKSVTGGTRYVALAPSRILNTANGTGLSGVFTSHVARTLQVTGTGGVATTATGVTGAVTVSGQKYVGYLFVGPTATNYPTTSTLNFPINDIRANGVTVALGTGGKLSITYAASSLTATTNVMFDLTGYFTP